MEEEKCHKEVHTLLRDAVTQELGADPALGQPGSAAENRVLLLEPVRRETRHCSSHTPQDPQQPLGIWQERREGQKSARNTHTASQAQRLLAGPEILEGKKGKRCYMLPSNNTKF